MAQTIRNSRKHRQPKPVMQSAISRADHPGRVWGGKPVTVGVQPHQLPRNHKKWKPARGSKRFTNGPAQAKPDQMWKYYDVTIGKYIYALSRPKGEAGKGWVKA